jgi:hypothetical protein
MVVVEVSQKEVCSAQDAKGKCTGDSVISCSAGTPFVLPDTSKPFLVNSKSGFGKAGVDVAITERMAARKHQGQLRQHGIAGNAGEDHRAGSQEHRSRGAAGQCKASASIGNAGTLQG